jgi:hypothetical protein
MTISNNQYNCHIGNPTNKIDNQMGYKKKSNMYFIQKNQKNLSNRKLNPKAEEREIVEKGSIRPKA